MSKKPWIGTARAICPAHQYTMTVARFLLCETYGEAVAQVVRAVIDMHECPLVIQEAVAYHVDPELVISAASEISPNQETSE